MSNTPLRAATIRLAYENPELRPKLLPLLTREAAAAPADVQMFMGDLERTIMKHFPQGFILVQAGQGDISIATATLPKGQQPNKIIQNDPAYQTFWIFGAYNPEGLQPKLRVEISQGGKLHGPNFSRGQKIGWRNKAGTSAQILKHFDRYYAKLRGLVNSQ
jgi:hypothetical protein